MRLSLLFVVFVIVACGGSSRDLDGSRGGKDSNGGDGGTDSGGGGTRPNGGTAGTAGVAAGANGGAGARGGTTSAGDAGEPSGGVGGVGARGGTAGTDVTGGTAGAGATPSITSCTDSFRFLGVWEGSILDFYFEPLETMVLEVTPDEELGGYQATITIGSGDPPPPVTNGNEPYPDLEYWGGNDGTGGVGPGIEPWPGFAHTVMRGAGCDDVFRVSISAREPWDEWCRLQEPVYTDGQGWGCTYRGGGSFGGGMCQVQDNRGQPLAEYPQWKCEMCGAFTFEGGVCTCDEAGCSFNRTPSHTYDFELVDDGVMSGPAPNCGDCTVRLERVE